MWVAVIGTNNTSAPAPPAVVSVPAIYTVVKAPDCEAILIASLPAPIIPVPLNNLAESEAKYRDPLLNIDN